MMKRNLLLITIIFQFNFLHAQEKLPRFERSPANQTDFSVGNQWDRRSPETKDLAVEGLKNIILSTAKIYGRRGARNKDAGVGTGLYLGKHNGEHIMLTNFHVVKNDQDCETIGNILFHYLDIRAAGCKKIILSLPSIDASLIALQVTSDNSLTQIPSFTFDTETILPAGTKLFTGGYGGFQNGYNVLKIDTSSNCQLMRSNEIPFYIRLNKSKTPLPALIHACEVSDGDSGSAIVSAETGKIVGLNHFVATERSPRVKDDHIIEEWVTNPSQEMLTTLAYAFPSVVIKETLEESLIKTRLEEKQKAIIESVLTLF